MDPDPVRSAEADLVALSDALTRPAPAECLVCFVDRMLTTFGCDGTFRWVRRWRPPRTRPWSTRRSPPASAATC